MHFNNNMILRFARQTADHPYLGFSLSCTRLVIPMMTNRIFVDGDMTTHGRSIGQVTLVHF